MPSRRWVSTRQLRVVVPESHELHRRNAREDVGNQAEGVEAAPAARPGDKGLVQAGRTLGDGHRGLPRAICPRVFAVTLPPLSASLEHIPTALFTELEDSLAESGKSASLASTTTAAFASTG